MVFVDGLPGSVRVGGVSFGVDVDIFQQASFTNDTAAERAWRLAALTLGSAEEHGIFEQLLNVPAVSTVRLLEVANGRRVPILAIDRTNLQQQLARLDTFCEDFIREDVEAGFLVVVPERNIQFEEWFGIAWIRADTRTGVSNYFICGGIPSAGGGTATPRAITREVASELSRRLRCLVEGMVRIIAFEIVGAFGLFFFMTGGLVVAFSFALSPPVAVVIGAAHGLALSGLGLYLVSVSIREHLEEARRLRRC